MHEAVLFEIGDHVDRVFFPHSGVISLTVELAKGQAVEAAMIGRDSMLGASFALDDDLSLNRAIVHVPGAGESLEIGRFREVAKASVSLRTTLLRHERFLFAQAQQSAACNASHTVEARLLRWLLQTRDLSGSNSLSFVTQKTLAQILGGVRHG
jgi:CRP-like cAMP-binding protein